MTQGAGETFPLRIQLPVYALALFTGNLQPIMSVVMPLWALELGASPLLIGLIISSRQILVVTLSIHGGALLDRFGQRRVIVVMAIVGAAATGLFPVLPFVWAAIVLQMIFGFAESTNWIGTQALVGKQLKGHAVFAGRMTAAARVGGFIGPAFAGLAWQQFGAGGGFACIAAWVLCGAAASCFLSDERSRDARPTGSASGESAGPASPRSRAADMMPRLADYRTAFRLLLLPAVALVIMATVMRQTGTGIQSSFYGVWLKEIGYSAGMIGLLIGISSAAAAGSALTIGPLTRRLSAHWLLLIMTVLSIIAIAVTPLLGTLAALVAAMVLRGVAQGLNLPLMMTIAAQAVGHDLQGRVAALRISFNRFGGALVPLAMGALVEVIGMEPAFYVVGAAGVVLICLLAAWVARSPNFR